MPAKTARQSTQLDRVHIHFCGNGHLGFRLTAGHFGKEPQSNQRALAPPLGTSLGLGVPVIRQGFGGPPPRAIHGAGRLNRHPCRFTPQIPVEFRPAWFDGAPEIKITSRSRARSRAARFASWLPLSLQSYVDTYGNRRQASSHSLIGLALPHSTGSLTGLAMIAFNSLVIGNSRFKPLGGIGCSNQRW